VPRNLHRRYATGHLHFITSSCYHRRPFLARAARRDLFLHILEQVRRRYDFVVVGYVVMPEHFHLLITEPARGTQSTVMQVLKQRFARKLLGQRPPGQGELWESTEPEHVWQRRFYDFVVLSEKKKIEKLRYIHRNPVKRGLVDSPDHWRWSSFRFYALGETGLVFIDRQKHAEMAVRHTACALR
jgi:putative transposase